MKKKLWALGSPSHPAPYPVGRKPSLAVLLVLVQGWEWAGEKGVQGGQFSL